MVLKSYTLLYSKLGYLKYMIRVIWFFPPKPAFMKISQVTDMQPGWSQPKLPVLSTGVVQVCSGVLF